MMQPRARALTILALTVLALLAAPAASGQGQERFIEFIALEEEDLRFVVPGTEEPNPPVTLARALVYTIELDNTDGGGPHSLWFGEPIDDGIDPLPSGDSTVFEIKVPEDATGTTEYWCTVHPEEMRGVVRFAETPSPTNGGEGAADRVATEEEAGDVKDEPVDTPGPGAALVLVTLAALGACARSLRR